MSSEELFCSSYSVISISHNSSTALLGMSLKCFSKFYFSVSIVTVINYTILTTQLYNFTETILTDRNNVRNSRKYQGLSMYKDASIRQAIIASNFQYDNNTWICIFIIKI